MSSDLDTPHVKHLKSLNSDRVQKPLKLKLKGSNQSGSPASIKSRQSLGKLAQMFGKH